MIWLLRQFQKEGFRNGAADGAMWGGIFALGATIANLGLMARQGYAIGKTGVLESVAASRGLNFYSGMKSFNFVKRVFGENLATKMGWIQNKFLLRTIMFFGGPIYKVAGPLTGTFAREVALILGAGYKYFYDI